MVTKKVEKPVETTKKTEKPGDRKKVLWDAYKLDVRKIKTSYNHRNALSNAFQKAGYGVFPEDVPPGSDKPPLWELGTSDDIAKRAEFARLMNEYDRPKEGEKDDGSGGIIALSYSIMSVGLLEPIGVRDNGNDTYQLVFGHRRSLAVLYLYCNGIIKLPVIDAKLEKGNSNQLQAKALAENVHRKSLTKMEQAKAYQMAINGGESPKEIAEREGVSTQTVINRISLLELNPDDQKRVDEGRLNYTKALEIIKDIKSGGTGKTKAGKTGEDESKSKTRRMMSRSEIEEWWTVEKDSTVKKVLSRILKMDGNSVPSSPKKGEAVLPPEEILMDGEALNVDDQDVSMDVKGRIIVAK